MQLTKGAIGNLINRYKAVLKKCHLMNTFGSLAVAGMLVMGGAGMAVAADADKPLEGKNDYSSTENPEVNHLMGGWLVKEDPTTEATGNITLDVKGGTISEIIGGSYVKATPDFKGMLTHGTITTTISGSTTSSQFVVGGSKIANSENAHLKTGDISLTIKGGTFGQKDGGNNTDYELVMGGNYLKADLNANDTSKAEAGHITVNIDDGEFKTSVAGGSTAHVYNGNSGAAPKLDVTDASTSVTITGGTFDHSQSTGGGAINLDPSIIGGGLALVADGITAEGVSASSTITGNTLVTIAQAEGKKLIINDKVLGGSLAQGKGATVTIGTEGGKSTSAVIVDNVSKVGDLVGGNMAEGGKATLHGDSYVVVEAGKVEGDVMGGSYVRGSGTVTTTGNTGVVFNADNKATVNQAEYLVGGDKVLASSAAAQSTGTISGTSSVTVNGNASVTTGAVVGGSFSRVLAGTDNRAASATVANSVVTINGGKSIAGVVGGGLAEHLSGNGSATSTVTGTSAVYVNDGNLTNIVYTTKAGQKASSSAAVAGAGFATGKKATASVGNSVVVIDGADTVIKGNENTLEDVTYDNQDSAKVVAGGVAINGGTVSVANTSLTMKDGKVTGDLVGGNLLEKDGEEQNSIASTTVNVEGGKVNGEIYGGSYVRNTVATSEVDNTTVNISGGTIGATEPQGWAQYVVGGGKAMSNATMTVSNVLETAAVNISGGKITRGAVVGGGFARAQGAEGSATANVKDSVVNLTGGTLVGVVGGGLAENLGTADSSATASVTTASLTIDGNATVNGIIYKGNDGEETPSSAVVIGGGLAYSKNDSAAGASVGTANTTINGGTINGNVFAGGLADGTSATANVTNANLTISGNADIQGNIHAGGYALKEGTATVENATVTFDGNSSFAGKVFGQGHAEESGTATVNESTLAFTNYNGAFNGQVVGFTNLDVAEGSTLQLGTLSTGEDGEGDTAGVFNKNALTLTGGGVVSAAKVVADKELTVDSLATLTSSNIAVTDTGVVTVEGTLDATGTVVTTTQDDINVAKGGILNVTTATALNGDFAGADLANGGTVNLTGTTDGELTVRALQGKFGDKGVINAGDNTVAGMFKPDAAISSGTVSIDDIINSNIATNETKTLVVTGVESSDTLNGAWKGVEFAEGGSHLTVNTGTLQLTGDTADFAVVDGGVVFANSGTLMLGDTGTANSGLIKGDVTFSNDASTSNMTLLVTGNQDAAFVVDGNIDGHNGTKGQLLAQGGATLTANGNITAGTITADGSTIQAAGSEADPAVAAGDIVATDITAQNGGVVAAAGSVTATTVKLDNGGLQAEKDITLRGAVTDANGALVAKTGNINASGQNLAKAADGQLSLVAQQGTITANNITATNVVAKQLNTGNVNLSGGLLGLGTEAADASTIGGTLGLTNMQSVVTGNLEVTGAATVDGGTLVAQSGDDANLATLTFNDDATFTNGAVAVADSIVMADTTGTTGSGGTLTVGTGDDTVGGTTLSARHIDLNGGMLLVDPDWVLPSSNVAVKSMGTPPTGTTPATYDDVVLNGDVGVGQNSYLALGIKDTGWLPGVVAGYTKGVGLSKDGVTAALGVYKGLTIDTGKALLVDGSKMDTATDPALTDAVNDAAGNSATFADNSLLVINGADDAIAAGGAAISFEATGTLKVDAGAKLLITDAVAGQAYTIVDNVNAPTPGLAGWKNNGMTSTTDMISLGDAEFTPGSAGAAGTVTTSAKRNDAATVFPNLSDGMANAVNDLYTGHDGAAGEPRWDYADVNSADMGVRFLSRATDNRFLGADKDAAASTIESAARIAFAGAVPQMTKMASDAGSNAVVNRLGFANPADGAQAMDAEGKIVDRNTTGFALWIAPLWQNQHGWGMEADNLDYGFNGNLGGVSLGADYTFENAIRAGITFNIGGGYAESSGGDLNSTENRMSFWGLGAYAGWNYENFGLMADVSYTSTWNDLKQDMDSRMGMGDLEADVQASAISAGLRAEYKLETSVLDVIPHIGVRYMSLNTWGFDAESNGGTVLEGDGFHQDIWTFPVGVTFTKDFTLDSGWSFKPSVDFSVIPAAGDIKAKQDVAFTGLPGSYEVETQMMDYLTWQGGVGLEMGNDTMSFGVNYTLQAGQHTTGHGVFGSFRYEF